MLYDYLKAEEAQVKPRYRQIYLSLRRLIEDGSLKKGTRLPSIRKLCEELEISKTTVIAAYDQLTAEGYITAKAQKGYYVAADFLSLPQSQNRENSSKREQHEYFEYDFSGKSIDPGIMDLSQWRKCVKDVINRDYLLTSYGDPQGEPGLRSALSDYAMGTRSVNSSSDNIIVGAGTQPILLLLCSILGSGKRAAIAGGSFVQSEYVFQSFGYEVCYFDSDRDGARVESLEKLKPDLVLINPNFTEESGESMPVTRRLELIDWARKNNALIIEDDYNGELRYSSHPMPCVQHYDTENTVYLGSFSKVLLPSVRLSYMALPERIMQSYRKVEGLLNQTASKTEQLALAQYINSRKIDAHLRRARRVYLEKSREMLKAIKEHLPGYKVIFNETSLYCAVVLREGQSASEISDRLKAQSVKLMRTSGGRNTLALSFSGIALDKINDGVRLIAQSVNQRLLNSD